MKRDADHIPFHRPLRLEELPGRPENLAWEEGDPLGRCEAWLSRQSGSTAFLTPSCTDALEMAALLCELQPGDEVILPSFTHPSSANAFALRQCRLRFVDIDPATMNLDPATLDQAITPRTKAVVITHYAGIACDLTAILARLEDGPISLIEDAAHGIGASFHGRALGSFGRCGALSFHHTKNIHCGEGGALCLREPGDLERARIIRDKGTNRAAFKRGQVGYYHWVDIGSSFSLSPLCAAFLEPQLNHLEAVNVHRLGLWNRYHSQLAELSDRYEIARPSVPPSARHNAHIYYLHCRTEAERTALQTHLLDQGIGTAFHYIPLHSAPAGRRWGEFVGEDRFTTDRSRRLLRLPLFHALTAGEVDRIVEEVRRFYRAP